MSQYISSIDVAGGMIKADCPRCRKTAYLAVTQNSRRRIYRCRCAKSTTYNINYRKERREVTYGPARVIMKNASEQKIYNHPEGFSRAIFWI